jgi:hypothetical protein
MHSPACTLRAAHDHNHVDAYLTGDRRATLGQAALARTRGLWLGTYRPKAESKVTRARHAAARASTVGGTRVAVTEHDAACGTVGITRGCRIGPRRRPFVVDPSNHGGAAHIDSACGRVDGVASANVVVALSNALDFCDSLTRKGERRPYPLNTTPAGAEPSAAPMQHPEARHAALILLVVGTAGSWRCGRRPAASRN